jgi:hypothetical protein
MGVKGDLVDALRSLLREQNSELTAQDIDADWLIEEVFRRAGTCSCFVKAQPDEPIFVLRAKDISAPMVVRSWAGWLALMRTRDAPKVQEAVDLATKMEQWQRVNGAKIPD